ncbi:GNAT family N-acetyltransferase [Candidatus Leptofilum sp.]|uniref:GNAT family N-acetyltransferase n=1 Tax=Candidatus Leptofilum sp. TaxID=3241576 RepID=UPI003B5A033C
MNTIDVAMETAVPGLVFRRYHGEEDFPAMAKIINESNRVDGVEWVATVEEIDNDYQHLTNCDSAQDMIVAEVHGEMVGYGRCSWEQEVDGDRIYFYFAHLLPAWRDEGIRRAMLQFNEDRLRAIAATHPNDGKRWLGGWAAETETHWENLLLTHGYKPIRYFMEMVRPTLDDIPNLPLPAGIEVRRGTLEAWRQIWEAMREAFQDHWGHTKWPEEEFVGWSKDPNFNPNLWQVAWDGDEVAGGVLNFINQVENETYDRKRGYTEDIFVRRPWRKQGLAKALIARSFQVLKDEGMTEAALSVDAENPTGAVRLYTGLGFETVKQSAAYRKPL